MFDDTIPVGEKTVRLLGDPDARDLILRPVSASGPDHLPKEIEETGRAYKKSGRLFAAIPIADWNRELSPWEVGPVLGEENFGCDAEKTLDYLLSSLLPTLRERFPHPERRVILAGYSLAGLFGLWASTRSDAFDGIAAVSPSVWFPEWIAYSRAHRHRTGAVYLSLGDKEEKTRNRLLASVGRAVCEQEGILRARGVPTVLEWNEGNHFANVEKRVSDGIVWVQRTLDTM